MRRQVGYVSFLALVQLITLGNFAALQLANAAVFSLTAPITYLLVRRVVENSLVAAVTGLAVIHWPSFIYYGRTLYSETATLPLFTLYLTIIPRGSILTTDPVKGWLPWFLSGSFLGLCVLFRPMYLLFFSFVVLILLLEEKHWKSVLSRTFSSFLGFIVVIAPYSIYLTAKAGDFVLVSTTGGEALATGLNPGLIQRGYIFATTPDGRTTWFLEKS
jgi:hypothetical protein